jgi:hypothetical protein
LKTPLSSSDFATYLLRLMPVVRYRMRFSLITEIVSAGGWISFARL